ncbi:MAG: acyl-CoA dehydrogenase family protein [Blastomonas fulva]|uniref:acyl-CoA dehydrogenase family protein n=1 Tax=Blastomonas fulva TaxID=1550728 RepID=UPI0024E1AF67|nr:acyl-CoA dehydrogenase family protein [Blastomonas fulva]MDK2759452.1 acyl-CoA dehydrogenase family protein [Blastomonas fulva]
MMSDTETLRDEVRAWLAEHWDADTRRAKSGGSLPDWMDQVVAAGWAVPGWPAEWWGRGLDKQSVSMIVNEFRKVGAPGAGQDRTNITANSVMQFGNDELKRKIIPEFLSGRASQCLLYSEPGAGSDLAAVRTRADFQGDHYIVTGQKVWTSGAQNADYGLLIARTDWDVPKHEGLSFFIIEMRQPGIEIRPINQITGDSHFNEVFLDGAVVPVENRVGDEGEGWKVMQTALAVERLVMGDGAGERRQGSAKNNVISLIDIARETGKINDPVARQEIAQAIAYRKLNALNMLRAKQEMAQGSASPIMSLGKLAMSRILHEDARVMTKLLGAASMLDGPTHLLAADINYRTANAYMTSIGGGTDQIQRNIIGERVLGLPRETEADRNEPFRESRAVTG